MHKLNKLISRFTGPLQLFILISQSLVVVDTTLIILEMVVLVFPQSHQQAVLHKFLMVVLITMDFILILAQFVRVCVVRMRESNGCAYRNVNINYYCSCNAPTTQIPDI